VDWEVTKDCGALLRREAFAPPQAAPAAAAAPALAQVAAPAAPAQVAAPAREATRRLPVALSRASSSDFSDAPLPSISNTRNSW
jgi:hypothetical protein